MLSVLYGFYEKEKNNRLLELAPSVVNQMNRSWYSHTMKYSSYSCQTLPGTGLTETA